MLIYTWGVTIEQKLRVLCKWCFHQGCGVGAQAILDGWCRSQKFLNGGAGTWNLSSRTAGFVEQANCTKNTMDFSF